MKNTWFAAGWAMCALMGCGASPVPAPPVPARAEPSSTAFVDAGAPPSAKAALPSPAYQGLGVESIAPEVLAKYRPLPLPPDVSRRIQALFDLRGPGVGRLAPDGKALYFGWAVTGVPQIWKVDGPLRFPTQLTGGEDVTRLESMTPDGKFLVVSRDRKGEENPGLYLQPAEGGPLVVIQHEKGSRALFQYVSSDARYVYFVSNDKKSDAYAIYRYDVGKRERETVLTQDGLWNVVDGKDDGRLLLRKETGSLTAEVFEWKAGELTPLMGQGEKEEYDVAYGAKEGEILVLTNKLGEFRRLYSWTAGKLSPIGDDIKFDVASFQIDRRRTRILYQINENGFTRLAALDAKTEKATPLPKVEGADHLRAGPTTPDGRYTTLGVDDGRHPQQAYVIDWKTKAITPWHRPSTPEVDTTAFARAQAETYPARDGIQIPVLVRTPARARSSPCQVVVAFHGGPEAQAIPGFSMSAQAFVGAGFVFVEPNVRGSDGYGKSWIHADDGPKRLEVITDIEDAAKWAKKRFACDGKEPKVGIYGGSYGGYSVLMGMTMFAGAYDAGVDVVGISSLSTFLKNTAPYRRILRISEYGDPERDKDALVKLSPMTYLDRMKAPLLILQGATDPRVPAGEAIQIHEALEQKGIASPLMIFADEGHGAQKRENQVLMLGHAVAFFEKYLR
ncbi:MAG TPA: prolyl oligopeptidase family serine peptidase [Polyangiaceae bacterium]|nr:prolyl oligopeptidase family serine peptidase [Polyangiaceae bacterium]